MIRRLLSRAAGLALTAAIMLATAPSSHAQNLIADPYFANGVPPAGSTDANGNGVYIGGGTAETFGGLTGLRLSASVNGYVEFYPLAGYDIRGVDYIFTFLAAAFNPDIQTSVYAQFATTTTEGGASSLNQNLTSTELTRYTVTGTSTSTEGEPGYVYVQSVGGGDVFVTGLDFEAAPLPTTGGGVLSFGVLLAGLAIHRSRRRKAV